MTAPLEMPEDFGLPEALPIPDIVRKQLAEWGRSGGYAAKRSMTKAAMREKNRNAAKVRWAKYRKEGR